MGTNDGEKIMQRKFSLLSVVAVLTWGTTSLGAGMGGAMMRGGMEGQDEFSCSGVVLSTTNASRYTYVEIDTGKEKLWGAGPTFAVKVGDRVVLEHGMPARNFKSKALNRTFELLYLAGSISQEGAVPKAQAGGEMKLPEGHPAVSGKSGACPAPDVTPIQKPAGGLTVAEIWAGKEKLSGKTVVVRGKVVKVTEKILKMNWLHLRDGSGTEGSNDLVVTTKASVRVGDVVTVSGTLGIDRDFGAGYKYDAILEDAAVLAP